MNDCNVESFIWDDVMCERSFRMSGETFLLRYMMQRSTYGEVGQEPEEFYYGIRIWQHRSIGRFEYELYDQAVVEGFSEDYLETRFFLRKLCEGMVLPMSLGEIVDDWKSALCEGVLDCRPGRETSEGMTNPLVLYSAAES